MHDGILQQMECNRPSAHRVMIMVAESGHIRCNAEPSDGSDYSLSGRRLWAVWLTNFLGNELFLMVITMADHQLHGSRDFRSVGKQAAKFSNKRFMLFKRATIALDRQKPNQCMKQIFDHQRSLLPARLHCLTTRHTLRSPEEIQRH